MGKLGPTGRPLVMMLSLRQKQASCTCPWSNIYSNDHSSDKSSETSTGEAARPPSKVGVAATDIATGLYAHGAIMAALLSRQQTGKGVWIDCNLFESQVHSISLIGCKLDLICNETRLQA